MRADAFWSLIRSSGSGGPLVRGRVGPAREEVGPVGRATSGRRRHPLAGFPAWHKRWEMDSAEPAGSRATQTSGDPFHPTECGYEIWADAFWSLIRSSGSGGPLGCRSERRPAGGCSG